MKQVKFLRGAVTIVTRDESRGKDLKDAGAEIAVADVRDVEALRSVFQSGKRAFLLNPPADFSSDTDKEERENVAAILSALDGSSLEKVVAASTYGAFDGERCGDLTVLHEFEQALKKQSIPAAFNRAGYYMSNWAGMAEPVQENGTLLSFFPAGSLYRKRCRRRLCRNDGPQGGSSGGSPRCA